MAASAAGTSTYSGVSGTRRPERLRSSTPSHQMMSARLTSPGSCRRANATISMRENPSATSVVQGRADSGTGRPAGRPRHRACATSRGRRHSGGCRSATRSARRHWSVPLQRSSTARCSGREGHDLMRHGSLPPETSARRMPASSAAWITASPFASLRSGSVDRRMQPRPTRDSVMHGNLDARPACSSTRST
jgi:hypothetical protein